MIQLCTFYVKDTLFGINILQVKEINDHLKYTPVPDSVSYIKGLFNLRGQIITIFDLSKRLGQGETVTGEKTRNLILKTDTETASIQDSSHILKTGDDATGFIIDRISDVIEISEDDIQKAPANVGDISKEFISGVVELNKELLILLNIKETLKT